MTFVHPTRRYRLYFDETGTGDLRAHKKDQNQRYLSLTWFFGKTFTIPPLRRAFPPLSAESSTPPT
jgi:hypothetical protein